MRKSKIINIEGLGEVTVKEISPYAVYQAMNAGSSMGELKALALECVSLPEEKLTKLYSSEIEQLVDTVLEVNSSFFGIARKLKADGLIIDAVKTMAENLPPLFADLYKQAMGRLGITDGSVSPSPSTN